MNSRVEAEQVGGVADHIGDRTLRVDIEDADGRRANAEAPVQLDADREEVG